MGDIAVKGSTINTGDKGRAVENPSPKNGRDYNPKHLLVGQFPGQNFMNYPQPWHLHLPYDTLAIEITYHWACPLIEACCPYN